jgi:hypothetical protein
MVYCIGPSCRTPYPLRERIAKVEAYLRTESVEGLFVEKFPIDSIPAKEHITDLGREVARRRICG